MTGTSVKISLASMGVCAGFGGFGEAELEAVSNPHLTLPTKTVVYLWFLPYTS